MAGLTDNADFINAFNQMIQAINDLALSPPTVNVTVESASPSVNLSCAPDVNLSCGCGGGTGENIDSPPGQEGGTPPDERYETPIDPVGSTEYNERKCKIANRIWEMVHDFAYQMVIYDVDDLGALGVVAVTTMVGALLGAAGGGIGAFPGAVAGAVVGIVVTLMTIQINFGELELLLVTYQSDLVCALYNSTNADNGRDDFLQILTDNGAGSAETGLVELLFPNDLLNLLYFDTSHGLEEVLDGYTPTVDCGTCGGCASPTVNITSGNLVSQNGDVYQIASVYEDTGQGNAHRVIFRINGASGNCEAHLSGFSSGGQSMHLVQAWDGSGTLIHNDNTAPVEWPPSGCYWKFYCRADLGAPGQSFTLTVTIATGVC